MADTFLIFYQPNVADMFLSFVSQMWLILLFFDESNVAHALTQLWMPVGRVSVDSVAADVEIAFRQIYERRQIRGCTNIGCFIVR